MFIVGENKQFQYYVFQLIVIIVQHYHIFTNDREERDKGNLIPFFIFENLSKFLFITYFSKNVPKLYTNSITTGFEKYVMKNNLKNIKSKKGD